MPADTKVDILLVDDSANNLLALEAMLFELGQNLVKASSGNEALKRLLEQDFAVILMDIRMPEMDGFETAQLIRARERSRHIPILFLTAYGRTDAQIFKGYSVGAVDFLFKPIVPEILRSKVSVFVDLHKKTEEVKRQAQLLRQAEAREHDRELEETRRRYAAERLREEMEHERRIAEAHERRADELQRAEEALRKSNARLRLLSETANRLLLGARPQEFIGSLFSRLSEHLDLEVYRSYLVGEDGRTLYLDSYGGLSPEVAKSIRCLSFGDGVCGETAASRTPIITEDVARSGDPQMDHLRVLGISAHACYPLLAEGRLLGTLAFGTRRRPRFQPDELQVMQVVSDQVAMAMERARLIAELSRRAKDLAEADRRKDEFLAMLAHELRNPLAPILNAVHMLRLGAENVDPIQLRAISAMDRQVRHMIRLVDDLLDVSRIERGKIELRKEVVRLDVIIDHAVQTSRPLIDDRNHELSVVLPPEPVEIEVDPTRLAQVIANLLNNAAKYTDPGGSIWLTCERHDGLLTISVRDNGIGLSEDMRSSIFDLFVQSERGADRAQGGLGIGLTLVRNLVEMHGGSVVAHSAGVGQGSNFVVSLPIGAPAAMSPPRRTSSWPPRKEVEAAPAARSSALHVLVVEDNDDIRDTLKDLLEMCGHEVDVAEDGASAVEMTLALRPDVALVDIGLPGLDGYQVAQRLRSQMSGSQRTRLIALTGYGQPDDRRRAMDAGFDAHLVKPVDFNDLTRLLGEPP